MISSLTINQDNKVGDSDLMPIHSPLIFLVDATYSGAAPDYIYCDIKDETDATLIQTKCIPYEDVNATTRRFMLIAQGILQGYMNGFDDFDQSENSLVHVENITKQFKLVFNDPDENADDVELEIVAAHGVRQFGDNPNMHEQYNNDNEKYYAAKGQNIYIYFYNNDETNELSLIPSYEIKFIVSDSGGFVQDALVTINGESGLTNSIGEVSFLLEDGNYNYTITKDGYQPYNNSIIVNGGNLEIPVLISELELISAVFDTNMGFYGYIGIAEVGDNPYLLGDLIQWGRTDSNGNLTLPDVPGPKLYTVAFAAYPDVCSGKRDLVQNMYLEDLINNVVNLPANTLVPVTINIEDTLGNPIENVQIGRTPANHLQCKSQYYYTDVNGEANWTHYRWNPNRGLDIENTYDYACVKAGYITFSSSYEIDNDVGFVINVVMQETP